MFIYYIEGCWFKIRIVSVYHLIKEDDNLTVQLIIKEQAIKLKRLKNSITEIGGLIFFMSFWTDFAIISIIGIIIFVILIPSIATIILGMYLANFYALTGLVWWSFIIIFYIIIMGVLTKLSGFLSK